MLALHGKRWTQLVDSDTKQVHFTRGRLISAQKRISLDTYPEAIPRLACAPLREGINLIPSSN